MKHISVLAPIILRDPSTDERVVETRADGTTAPLKPITFAAHVLRQWLNAPAFADAEGIASLPRLVTTLKEAMPGGVWSVEDGDHSRLLKALEQPNAQAAWSPLMSMQLTPFADAVRKPVPDAVQGPAANAQQAAS